MRRGERRLLQIWLVFILTANGVMLTIAMLLKDIWVFIAVLGVIAFDLYWVYVRYYQRKKPRYPMVPPEGKGDIYFPRTDIPRPIYQDAREMQEKKRRLEKIKKMRHKKKTRES